MTKWVSVAVILSFCSLSLQQVCTDDEVLYIAPLWFTHDTQLCYKWSADGNAGQCGGGEPNELCAHVGTQTIPYSDNTDDRSGGCRMQWGIRSPCAPDWFLDTVQICYRWFADGDAGQCGGGADQILCAPIGSYTPEYRDDTDGRFGGCSMSWMLSIPRDSRGTLWYPDSPREAPEWLENVELCFLWYPDGDEGQCGGGVERELCARANVWTTYYRDDTDGRVGGCKMSWKLRVTR